MGAEQEKAYKGKKHRYLRARRGNVEVERPTTIVRGAVADFPLGEALALDRRSLSPGLAREVVWLSGLVAFEPVSQVLERVGGYQMPSSTEWQQVQQHGMRWSRHGAERILVIHSAVLNRSFDQLSLAA
jgi:hypothetical protein